MQARWWLWTVVMLVACGGSQPAYPHETCAAIAGEPANWCEGRVVELGVLNREKGGDAFELVELGHNAPGTQAPLVHRVVCMGCPLHVGEKYRGRLSKKTSVTSEEVRSILVNGQLITSMSRPFNLMPAQQYACTETGPAHWESDGENFACKPGKRELSFNSEQPHATGSCIEGWPSGIAQYAGDTMPINIRIDSAYTLKEPELAHDLFPKAFVDKLNAMGPDHKDHKFVLADGLPLFYFDVTFTSDSTGDHYGMNVTVHGPPDREGLEHGGTTKVLFTYSIEPLYITADKLLGAAAQPAFEMLYWPGGWDCVAGGARPRESLKSWCEERKISCTYGE